MDVTFGSFVWDTRKEAQNIRKHGVDFAEAAMAFADPERLLFIDSEHSLSEERLYCLGRSRRGVMTVRFTYRGELIRIIGAGYWRKGRAIYGKQKK